MFYINVCLTITFAIIFVISGYYIILEGCGKSPSWNLRIVIS